MGFSALAYDVVTTRFEQALSDFRFQASDFCVALSGGADSMALTLLAHDWAQAHGGHIVALTVDHGLRPESRREAEHVARWMRARGIEHHILTPEHVPAGNNLMQAARQWRYDALADFCLAHGIARCLLAHHKGDQRETVLLNAARGGDGLSGMPRMREYRGVQFLRPLLDVEKETLVAYLVGHVTPPSPLAPAPPQRGSWHRASGTVTIQSRTSSDDTTVAWIEDPSNRNTDFARVRVRQQLAGDAALRAQTDTQIAQEQAARRMREQALAEAAAACVTIDPSGYATLQRDLWRAYPTDLQQQLVADTLRCISGATHRVRSHEIERLTEALAQKPSGKRCLQHCLIMWDAPTIHIEREPARVASAITLTGSGDMLWDNRFLVKYDMANGMTLTLKALGKEGKKTFDELMKNYTTLHSIDGFQNLLDRLPPPCGEGGEGDVEVSLSPTSPPSLTLRPPRGRGRPSKLHLLNANWYETIDLPVTTPSLWHLDELVMLPHIPWRAATLPPELRCRIDFVPAKPLAATTFW